MSFIFDWLYSALDNLGLYNKKARILFLGLDNAGKTTLLGLLKQGRVIQAEPTGQPQREELKIDHISFSAHDLGGHKTARRVWKEYFPQADGLVYLVDSSDTERFDLSREALNGLLSDEELSHVPFLILANKVDKKTAVNIDELKHVMGLTHVTTGKEVKGRWWGKPATLDGGVRPLEVFPCSVVRQFGYADGFRWLSKFL